MTTSVAVEFPTVVHMLMDAAERAPTREAIVCGKERLSYRDYLGSVTAFAGELTELGARAERVAVLMANSADICVAMFAVHMAGAQLVPMNPRYTLHELRPLFTQSAPRVLVHDEEAASTAATLAREFGIDNCIAVGRRSRRLARAWAEPIAATLPLPRPGDPATLQFTGGTTGLPKGASISHGALMTNICQREALVPTRPDVERLLCVMPLFHCYAIHMCLHNMVKSRGTLVIVHPYRPDATLRTFGAERITLFGGSPTLFAGLMAHDEFDAADFSQLHITYSGSSPLPSELLRHWETRTGSAVIEGYGQSESGPVISFNPVQGARKLASVGVALPGTVIEIVDLETGQRPLPANACGEIRVRGPQVMNGYHGRPDETSLVLREGWLYTGDIGELDDDGYLFIRGRKKEMLKVSGFTVHPSEIENTLHAHPDVREAAVVGIPDNYRGQLPVAYIVSARADLGPEELERYCAGRLSRYKIPAAFHVVDALPKTAVGKTDKSRLGEWAEKSAKPATSKETG